MTNKLKCWLLGKPKVNAKNSAWALKDSEGDYMRIDTLSYKKKDAEKYFATVYKMHPSWESLRKSGYKCVKVQIIEQRCGKLLEEK